jgi:TP901 family phage tail tape measure protein
MARNLTIFTIFKAKDKISKPIRDISGRMQRTGKVSQRTGVKVKGMFKSFLGAQLAFAAMNKLRQGMNAVTQEFISFDQALTAAGAKFGDMYKRGTEGFQQLKKTARDIGATTEFTATQAAEGLDFLAMAGFDAAQSMALLPGVVNLATSTQQDLARSTDIASDALGAFGLMTDDTGQLTENFNRILDVMSKTTVTANTDMETLFEAVKKGAPTFTSAGQSVETFNALVGTMANSGVKGSEAGTQLRNMMLRLAAPTKEAQGVLNKLNISTQDADGNFRDAIDILADFETATKDMGTAQKTAALSTVFGARTVNGINVLLKDGADSLREYRDQLKGATGASKELAEEMRKSLQNTLAKIRSGLTELGFKFIELFGDRIKLALNGISSLIEKTNQWLSANEKIIQQGFDKIFSVMAEKIKIVVNILREMIQLFAKAGEEQNVFSNLQGTFSSIKKTLDVLFTALQSVWDVLKETGVIDFIVARFNNFLTVIRIILATLRPMIKLLVFLFKIVAKILSPVIKLATAIEKLKGRVLTGVLTKLEGGGQPKSSEARLRQQGINNNTTNTNIEKNQLDVNFNNLPGNATVEKQGNFNNIALDSGVNL